MSGMSEHIADVLLHRANTLVAEAGAVVASLQHGTDAGASSNAAGPVEVRVSK